MLSTLGRNVASSSRQTLQRSLGARRPAAISTAHTPLRTQSTLRTSPSFALLATPSGRNLQYRYFGASATARDNRPRTETLYPETTPSISKESEVETSEDAAASVPVTGQRTPIGQIEQRLAITFTCTVDECGHRSTHQFSKRSYTKGIVIIQCPGCKNRHLIADNLSWFTQTEHEPRTIEQMIEAKGGKVTRGTLGVDGHSGETIEILS